MKKRDENFGQDYVYFVYAQPFTASYNFSEYQDSAGAVKKTGEVEGVPGRVVSISYRLRKDGQPEKYVFNFSSNLRDRALRVHKSQTDIQGINVVDFLKAHPECKDSPNGKYADDGTQLDVYFKIKDDEGDAQKLLEFQGARLKAEMTAFNLTDEEVFEIAPMFGEFSLKPIMARHTVMDLASNRPDVFMEVYNDPTRRAKSLIRRGISVGVLKLNGAAVYWNKTVLGLDEIEAAEKITSEKTIADALEKEIKRVL